MSPGVGGNPGENRRIERLDLIKNVTYQPAGYASLAPNWSSVLVLQARK
jgi:hypothetical protein